MIVIGCDPGPSSSALVVFNGDAVLWGEWTDNATIEAWLDDPPELFGHPALVIEQVENFGMSVGASVFETVFHSGRFAKAWKGQVGRLPRRVIKQHICHTARATDANIRQALIDRFGGQEKAVGKKAAKGPLFSLKGHLWAAFAVAITWHDQHADQPQEIRPGVSPDF